MSWTKEAVEEAVKKVGAKAAIDAEFRSLCVSDIHAAIQQESGLEVPASFKIGVLDQSANHLNLILPPFAKEEDELLESELESVAGGSKSGATDFFNGIAEGVGIPTDGSAEAIAGNVIGTVISLGKG
ncbi:hypothetical protein [Paenibacillus glycinis]|uniref:NHLP leader peptide family natural product n=1 Tax=Paenibacillus glycinis TaxID=2697035 RepID=A0ABW9XR78_9BACL|nr:hypothetical protein [Paenibacillus glycinis]NBD25155.1 hypothetical protein [Paenibacillus glycinis]